MKINLKQITKYLVITALVGLLIAFVSFKEASIKVDGQTYSIEEFIMHEINTN